MTVGTSWNILRPETIESLFYLWRLTGNKTYKEWGWNIFQAFEKNSRIESGYVGLKDVSTSQPAALQHIYLSLYISVLHDLSIITVTIPKLVIFFRNSDSVMALTFHLSNSLRLYVFSFLISG